MDSWWTQNWKAVLIIAIVFVILDKGLTFANMKAVNNNYPGVDPYSIERNPVAKWFFVNFGALGGSILFGIISIGLFFLTLYFFSYPASFISESNKYGIALYALMILYSLVVINNVYFLLKYSKIIP